MEKCPLRFTVLELFNSSSVVDGSVNRLRGIVRPAPKKAGSDKCNLPLAQYPYLAVSRFDTASTVRMLGSDVTEAISPR